MCILCCCRDNHPKDWFCNKVLLRSLCGGGSVDDNGTVDQDGSGRQAAPPDWLFVLEERINSMPNGPTPQQVLSFAQGLKSRGFARETLAVTRYMENNVPLSERLLHSQNYLIQAEAFEALGEARAAKTSLKMATKSVNARTERRRLDGAFDRIFAPVDGTNS